jgi:hypothetical protein
MHSIIVDIVVRSGDVGGWGADLMSFIYQDADAVDLFFAVKIYD